MKETVKLNIVLEDTGATEAQVNRSLQGIVQNKMLANIIGLVHNNLKQDFCSVLVFDGLVKKDDLIIYQQDRVIVSPETYSSLLENPEQTLQCMKYDQVDQLRYPLKPTNQEYVNAHVRTGSSTWEKITKSECLWQS